MATTSTAHQRDLPLRANESPQPETHRTAGYSVDIEPGAKEMGCAVEISPRNAAG